MSYEFTLGSSWLSNLSVAPLSAFMWVTAHSRPAQLLLPAAQDTLQTLDTPACTVLTSTAAAEIKSMHKKLFIFHFILGSRLHIPWRNPSIIKFSIKKSLLAYSAGQVSKQSRPGGEFCVNPYIRVCCSFKLGKSMKGNNAWLRLENSYIVHFVMFFEKSYFLPQTLSS